MRPDHDAVLSGFPEALVGEFELQRELGHGGMGIVFLARDVHLDRLVALKVLPPYPGQNASVRERFLREARTAAQLSHPNIVGIHRADERAGFAFFVMEFVDGESLGQRVRDRGALPPVDAVRHLREVTWALAYAHARGVIHRDVKPENIMIERGTNRALVTDFGIARSERATGMTSDGHILGTAHFMSPEQIQGAPLDGRSDLYSLGVVGFYLLSGRLPFESDATSALLVAHITRPAPTLRSVAPGVPVALAAVIDRCLAKHPDERFENGETLADALGKALEDTTALPEGTNEAQDVLSEDQAAMVWRRAALLQAEASARLDRETRSNATNAIGRNFTAATASGTASLALPADSYRVQDVQAAAVEAGISDRFVALALSELPRDKHALTRLSDGGIRDVVGRKLLHELVEVISASRVIRASPRDVLKMIGVTFQGPRFRLFLREQIGAHPLDGGILVFGLPEMDSSGTVQHSFSFLRHGLFATEIRATLRQLEHDRNACEVTVLADARPGLNANVWGYAGLAAGTTAAAGALGGLAVAKAMALTGALIAGPITVTVLAAAALAVAGSRAAYRWEGRKANHELEELLRALDISLHSRSIFEGDPPV
jgi:eukaryotic-like serine/threonine-protein kinase